MEAMQNSQVITREHDTDTVKPCASAWRKVIASDAEYEKATKEIEEDLKSGRGAYTLCQSLEEWKNNGMFVRLYIWMENYLQSTELNFTLNSNLH